MIHERTGHRPFLILIACFLLGALLLPGRGDAASRRKGPYLILTGKPTSMTVLWQLDGTATCTLEWGTDRGYGLGRVRTTEHGDDHQHAHTIDGLEPGTLYFYRVSMDGRPYEGSFRTPPGPDSERLKFMAYGDTRTYPLDHDEVAAAMWRQIDRDPAYRSLLVVVGDLVGHGREEQDWDEQFFDPSCIHLEKLLANIPYESCIGNHELKGDGPDLFLKYFPYPWTAPHYGSFDYGPAHFTYVDQFEDYAPGSAQYAWIVSDLARTSKPWRFVVLHEPGWSAGGHRDNTDVQEILQPLFEKYHVAIVFAGHNHYYARAVVNGVQHITTGGGGAPLYRPDPTSIGVVAVDESHHYCRIEIAGRRLDFAAVRMDGTVIDTFHLIHDPARKPQRRAIPVKVQPAHKEPGT